MTLDELKKEAKKQGYYLQKAPKPYEKLKPCLICGNNRRDHFVPHSLDKRMKVGMKCTGCGRVVLGSSERDVHKKWNELYAKEGE